jgi:hypothetical protein
MNAPGIFNISVFPYHHRFCAENLDPDLLVRGNVRNRVVDRAKRNARGSRRCELCGQRGRHGRNQSQAAHRSEEKLFHISLLWAESGVKCTSKIWKTIAADVAVICH